MKEEQDMQGSCPGEEGCAGLALSEMLQTPSAGGWQDTLDSASCSSPASLPEKQHTSEGMSFPHISTFSLSTAMFETNSLNSLYQMKIKKCIT